jgi:hypothetical protein
MGVVSDISERMRDLHRREDGSINGNVFRQSALEFSGFLLSRKPRDYLPDCLIRARKLSIFLSVEGLELIGLPLGKLSGA